MICWYRSVCYADTKIFMFILSYRHRLYQGQFCIKLLLQQKRALNVMNFGHFELWITNHKTCYGTMQHDSSDMQGSRR